MSHDRKALLIAGAIILGIFGLPVLWYSGTYRQERLDFCSTCGSKRHVEFHRLFAEGGARTPFTEDYERIQESLVCRDLMQPGHVHEWVMSWLEMDGIGGVRATGRGFNSPLRMAYEQDAEFRKFLTQKLASGAVTRGQLKLLFAESTVRFPTWREGEGRKKAPSQFGPRDEALLQGARSVVAEYEAGLDRSKRIDWIHSATDRQPPPR